MSFYIDLQTPKRILFLVALFFVSCSLPGCQSISPAAKMVIFAFPMLLVFILSIPAFWGGVFVRSLIFSYFETGNWAFLVLGISSVLIPVMVFILSLKFIEQSALYLAIFFAYLSAYAISLAEPEFRRFLRCQFLFYLGLWVSFGLESSRAAIGVIVVFFLFVIFRLSYDLINFES